MVQAGVRKACIRLSLLSVVALLSGCAAGMGIPATVSEFCQVGATQLPILLSRKDSLETKRQVAALNETHARLCLKQAPQK